MACKIQIIRMGSSVIEGGGLLQGAALRASPDRQAERDLVAEVGQVVQQVPL